MIYDKTEDFDERGTAFGDQCVDRTLCEGKIFKTKEKRNKCENRHSYLKTKKKSAPSKSFVNI